MVPVGVLTDHVLRGWEFISKDKKNETRSYQAMDLMKHFYRNLRPPCFSSPPLNIGRLIESVDLIRGEIDIAIYISSIKNG